MGFQWVPMGSNITDIRDQDTDTRRPRDHERTEGEDGHLQANERGRRGHLPSDPVALEF